MLGVIQGYGRDHSSERMLHDIGRIKSSAQAHYQQQHVGGMTREQDEARRRRDLEQSDRRPVICAFALGQSLAQLAVGHEHAAALSPQPKTLVEANKMRR